MVDTLFSILDFNKFKDMMIAFKLDNVNATAIVNNTVDSFSTYHADLMDDAYNLLKDEEDNKNWKVTHQDENRSIYVMEGKTDFNLKVVKDIAQLRKFVSVFRGVNYDKIKDFIGDFGKWITCDTIKAQGGPMSWMNNMKEVKRIDEDS